MKPSEIFEGPNSSLRKAFDEATKDTPQSNPVSDFFNAPEEVKRPVYEKALEKAQEEQSNIDWREEFWEICRKLNLREETVSGVDEIGMMQNFISQLLEAEKRRWREEVEEEFDSLPKDDIWNEWENGYYQAVNAVLQKLS